MKQLIYAVSVLMLLAGCGKDDEGEKTAVTLLEIQVGANYFNEPDETGYVFVSKPDGSLLDYKALANNTTVVLETNEPDVSSFTATILANRNSIEYNGLNLQSYLEVVTGSAWTLDKPLPSNAPSGSAKVVIENTGGISPSPFYISGSNSQGYSVDYSNGNLSV
ncbi:MAG: hypothetical protein HY842_15435, partial [Bacteroidetes bacterium]|nr:hypothetical protein [Bacteroidota bacterium]